MGTRAKGRALWLPDVLRDAGLPVEVVRGWEHAGKEPREWVAIVDHHTASNRRGGPRAALGTVERGRPDVPPPLANLLLDRNGVHVVIAAGSANHPGVSYLPLRGGISSSVKAWAIGREIELDGVGEPYPTGGRQYEAMSIGNAAICIYLGLDPAVALWDHKSICRPTGRKIDVRPYDLADGRTRVARRMTGRPIPPPAPATQEPLMVTPEDEKKIRAIVREEVDRATMITVDVVDKRYGSLRGWLAAIGAKLKVSAAEAAAGDTYANQPRD